MANFELAQKRLERWENAYFPDGTPKIYTDIPEDRGGETIYGVARKLHPQVPLWTIVDKIKSENKKASYKELNKILSEVKEIKEISVEFFKKNFWTPCYAELFKEQLAGDKVYLFAVNAGLKRSIKFMQEVLGTGVDGIVGKKTIALIENAPSDFVDRFEKRCWIHYSGLVDRDPTQMKFEKGWRNRCFDREVIK